jgi:MFS family permease
MVGCGREVSAARTDCFHLGSRIPTIQSNLGLTNAALGLCLLGTAVGSVISVPVSGWLVTRLGSRQVTTWSTLGFCLALVAPSLAINAGTLFAALTIYGAMAGANDVSINSQAVAVEKGLGTPTMSRFHPMFSIGGMIGAGLGAFAAHANVPPPLQFGTACVLFLIVTLCTSPFLLDANDNFDKPPRRVKLTRIPGVLMTLAIIGFCMFLSEGAIADWTGVYLRQVLFANSGLAAAGYAAFSAGMAIFRLLGDAVTKYLGPVLTVRSGALLAVLGLTLALAARSTALGAAGFRFDGGRVFRHRATGIWRRWTAELRSERSRYRHGERVRLYRFPVWTARHWLSRPAKFSPHSVDTRDRVEPARDITGESGCRGAVASGVMRRKTRAA